MNESDSMRQRRLAQRAAMAAAAAFATCIFVLGGSRARAESQPPTAEGIIGQMKAALEPERPSLRKIILVMHSADGETVEWTARQARKRLPDGYRMLTVVMAPKDLRGTALLVAERKNETFDAQWIYLPALRRVRKIVTVGAYESFLGTDFSYADLALVNMRDRSFKLLGEDTIGQRTAYKIEEKPSNPWYYSRVVTWVAENDKLPLRREYYDQDNHLWKVEEVQSEADVDGTPTLLAIVMKDKQANTSTELQVSEVQYDVKIPDDLFDPARLPSISEHPVWPKSKK
jgi:outer membrane lipoprotein-sorting protein